MKLNKSHILPTLLAFIGISILCALGTWQLHRLEWKTGLISALDAQYAKPAQPIDPAHIEDPSRFRRAILYGTYDFSKQILLGPRVYDNLPGQHVYTPLHLPDGSWIFVNRGWVSQHWSASDEKNPPQGEASVTGLLRTPDENAFAPDNIADKNQWYRADTAEFAAAKNLAPVHTYILYEENDGDTANYPIAAATKPQLDNNHLQYAFFWFAMAGVLFIIYALRFLKKDKNHV